MVETKTVDTSPGATGVGNALWRFQLSNHLDSAMMELDEAAGVLTYEEYHPYGSTAFHSAKAGAEVSAKRYRYTGKERDEETGLYYHGARYYAPWLGRWTAADPAGLVDGLNLYRYSRDNPVTFSDPSGTETKTEERHQIIPPGVDTVPEFEQWAKGAGIEYYQAPEHLGGNEFRVGPFRRVAPGEGGRGADPGQDFQTPEASAGTTEEPAEEPSPPAADTPPAGSGESIGEQFLRGAVLGDFGGEPTVASVVGQIAVGFTPLGVAADIRDFAAALKDLNEGKEGSGFGVAIAAIGFLPLGDLAKIAKKGDDLIEAGADARRLGGGGGGGGGGGSSGGSGGSGGRGKRPNKSPGELFEESVRETFKKKIIQQNEVLRDASGRVIGEIDFETAEALVEVGLSLGGKTKQLVRLAEIATERAKRLDVFYGPETSPGTLKKLEQTLRLRFGNRVRFIPHG